jgi:hypothetical protein
MDRQRAAVRQHLDQAQRYYEQAQAESRILSR